MGKDNAVKEVASKEELRLPDPPGIPAWAAISPMLQVQACPHCQPSLLPVQQKTVVSVKILLRISADQK